MHHKAAFTYNYFAMAGLLIEDRIRFRNFLSSLHSLRFFKLLRAGRCRHPTTNDRPNNRTDQLRGIRRRIGICMDGFGNPCSAKATWLHPRFWEHMAPKLGRVRCTQAPHLMVSSPLKKLPSSRFWSDMSSRLRVESSRGKPQGAEAPEILGRGRRQRLRPFLAAQRTLWDPLR